MRVGWNEGTTGREFTVHATNLDSISLIPCSLTVRSDSWVPSQVILNITGRGKYKSTKQRKWEFCEVLISFKVKQQQQQLHNWNTRFDCKILELSWLFDALPGSRCSGFNIWSSLKTPTDFVWSQHHGSKSFLLSLIIEKSGIYVLFLRRSQIMLSYRYVYGKEEPISTPTTSLEGQRQLNITKLEINQPVFRYPSITKNIWEIKRDT